MYLQTSFITVLATASSAQALQLSDIQSSASEAKLAARSFFSTLINRLTFPVAQISSTCPPVWNEISTTLTAQFLGDGECTDAARAAIRAAFHDCFNGACDGSLILADECWNTENRGLERVCDNLGKLAEEKQVGYADLIQFAAAHAIKTCPGGPTVPVKMGRTDSDVANALGVLPSGNAKAQDLIRLFASKGFSPIDLAALVGAHTAARQRTTDPSKAGATLDSTPGKWDNKFYSETIKGQAPFTLPADRDISRNVVTMVPFRSFAASQSAWSAAFVPAMTKLSMLGVSGGGLVDCTSALPGGSSKRDVKRAPLFERLGW